LSVVIVDIDWQAAYKNYCIDHNQILQSDRDPQILTVDGPNMPQTNPRWRTAAILKIRKIAILRKGTTDFDKIGYSDASWPSRYRQQIKIHDFENPRWQRPPSLKIEKS